ncbi:PREDICTED: metalloproteinase inhibitor 1 isoform X1 [Polistes canadensis]|uniref:metalloproteinase inhibitor 1 isoform X1 n=2 Tax=Polistes canadensis TaxID=91411 RepID=UPI000718F01B|nr:PREDICTED: metalloproteinase inhibitor 1 isoform X1 [Polistes canadensis]
MQFHLMYTAYCLRFTSMHSRCGCATMWRTSYCTYLLLGLLYLTTLQSATACSCMKAHPQTQFCRADFVAVVRIKLIVQINDERLDYKVKINRIFKATPKAEIALRENILTTPGYSSLCGVMHLFEGKTYVVSGFVREGRALISICDLAIPLSEVPVGQRKGLRLLYHHGCVCEISFTPWWRKGAVLESTGGKHCLWESSPGPQDCQEKYGVCKKGPNGCSWTPSVPYKKCIKEYQRKREQERLKEP